MVYPRPKTSKSHPEHEIYPYLLLDLVIDRFNQVWATANEELEMFSLWRGFLFFKKNPNIKLYHPLF